MTLGRFRWMVQLLMLAATVYGGLLVGHYMADKVSTSLPALSCAYDQQNGAYCVLIPIQHQLHHRVGEMVARSGEFRVEYLKPLGFTLLGFLGFFLVLNKGFCGWVCPMGTVQELLYKAGRRLRLVFNPLNRTWLGRVRPVKWLMLLLLVGLFPLLAGLGLLPHPLGDAYCQVCPVRIVTTLATLDPSQLALAMDNGVLITLGGIRNLIFGFVVVAAFTVRQPFCRICPMLALHALLRRVAPLRLVKTANPRCGSCSNCTRACPMDIPEIGERHGPAAFHSDCTLCGRCAEYCPDEGVIQLKFGPVALFRSRREYTRDRLRQERPDGSPRVGHRPPEEELAA